MDFKQSIKQEVDTKYANMIDGKGENPYSQSPNLPSYKSFSSKNLNYHNRLNREKESFNESLRKIKQTRQNRLQREENARREKEARRQERIERRKQTVITLLILTPVLLLFLWAYTMLKEPLSAFRYIHFGWVIAIYIVAFIVGILAAFGVEYAHRKAILALGSIAFLVMMIVGMANTPDVINISNASEFEAICNIPGSSKKQYELTADIDFGGKTSKCWGKIDNFTGTFNGNNHTISNLTVTSKSGKLDCGTIYVSESGKSNESSKVNGLGFVQMNNGVIENLRFDHIDIVTKQDSYQFIGVVAAYNAGTINNCLVTNCTITTTEESGGLCYVGGVVGYDNSGEISNVAFINTEDDVVFNIKSERCYLGGIAGESYAANINNVYVYQQDKDVDRCGGILGVAEALEGGWTGRDVPAYFTNCVNCLAPSIIYAYGQSVGPLVKESNVITLNSALTDLSMLTSEMGNWTYISDLGCYVPCTNFE